MLSCLAYLPAVNGGPTPPPADKPGKPGGTAGASHNCHRENGVLLRSETGFCTTTRSQTNFGTWENTNGRGDCPGRSSASASFAAQLHPDVAPQVSHLQHAPLRTSVNCPHSGHGSPSYPFSRA